MYCPACGTTFRAAPIWSDFGYVVTPRGPADIFGSLKPRIDDLSEIDRRHIYDVWGEFKALPQVIQFAKRAEIPLLLIRDVNSFVRSMPPENRQQLYTFVAKEALTEGQGIPVMCNCSYVTLLLPPIAVESINCWACGSNIKLGAIERAKETEEHDYIVGYTAEGRPKLFDVQGGYTKRVCELAPEEHKKMLAEVPAIEPQSLPGSPGSSV